MGDVLGEFLLAWSARDRCGLWFLGVRQGAVTHIGITRDSVSGFQHLGAPLQDPAKGFQIS